jgi:predicted NAD-dependent protein-ADP-ribosyltransferase YbiA (DUF1768 family)
MKNYHLGREEVYPASSRIWSFKNAEDIVNGVNLRISNMAGGFPFECNGDIWADSERLYLCGEYSHNTDEHLSIQKELLSATSGYAAKRFFKAKHKKQVRSDFTTFRMQWMLFCVWAKCQGNADFRNLLLSIPDDAILVENTSSDNGCTAEIWGCKNKELKAARTALAKKTKSREFSHEKERSRPPHQRRNQQVVRHRRVARTEQHRQDSNALSRLPAQRHRTRHRLQPAQPLKHPSFWRKNNFW